MSGEILYFIYSFHAHRLALILHVHALPSVSAHDRQHYSLLRSFFLMSRVLASFFIIAAKYMVLHPQVSNTLVPPHDQHPR